MLLPIYNSLGQCAGATGIPATKLKEAKTAGCPAFRWNRVYLGEFLTWFFARDLNGALTMEQIEKRTAEVQLEQLEDDRKKSRGELIELAAAQAFVNEVLGPLAEKLKSLSARLAPIVNPADPDLARGVLARELESLLPEIRALVPQPPAPPELSLKGAAA